jgi:alpha-galactosidase
MNRKFLSLLLVNVAVLCPNLMAQHLWWNLEGQRDATCLYGEITVLENFLGRDKAAVKLATYRLWLGKNVEQMQCLTRAKGDGIWGQLHDAYFLAEGDRTELDGLFAKLAPEYGTPVYGGGGKSLDPISKSPIPPAVITALQHLPRAGKVAVPRERAGKTPIKVFILAGQSNMEGYGGINTIDELGDHPTLGGLLQKVKRADGSFITRDDVCLYYHRGDQVISGPLTVGQGAGPDRIGPELMFGIGMGDYYEEPVLLIKTAWGGKDLYCDFRPPGAGKPAYEIPGPPRQLGAAYRQMIAEVHQCLDHLETTFPQFKDRPYELCGFVWFQGWNDFCVDRKIRQQVYQEYARNFAHLVQDLRAEFKAPHLPVVAGELGVDGEEHVNSEMAAFRAAQAKIASLPELKGTLGYVRTAPYWYAKLDELPRKLQVEERRLREKLAAQLREDLNGRPEVSDSKSMEQLINAAFEKARQEDKGYLGIQREHDCVISHWECHYYGSARVYCLVGYGLAEAMKQFLQNQ